MVEKGGERKRKGERLRKRGEKNGKMRCRIITKGKLFFRSERRERGLAMMLICVVFVFFLCNILALVANVLEVIQLNPK